MTTPTIKVVAGDGLHVRLDKATAAAAEDQRLRSDPFVRDEPVELPLTEYVRKRLAAGDLKPVKTTAATNAAVPGRAIATTSEK